MSLSATRIRQAKGREKPYKLYDSGGLYLIVNPSGGKWWRMKYTFAGKAQTLSLGTYPNTGLAEAREGRDLILGKIAQGVDPALERRQAKEAARREAADNAHTFAAIAMEWYRKQEPGWTARHAQTVISRLGRFILPELGGRHIGKLATRDYADIVRAIDARGIHETARRVSQIIGQITRYAVAAGVLEYDTAASLSKVVGSTRQAHFAAITEPAAFGALLADIEEYGGGPSTKYALRIMPYVFVRSGELRNASWSELDLDNAVWIIPAARMKMRRDHVVPLARQVVRLLAELRAFSTGRLLFPGNSSRTRAITDECLLKALRSMGYARDEMTVHGFRSAASTMLNERGYNRDWIEMQLAHAGKDSVRSAYNRAQWLAEQTGMMQEWADYLDSLRAAAGNREAGNDDNRV